MEENSRRKPRACRNLMLEFEEADDDRKEDVTKALQDEQRRSADLENEINEILATNLSSKIERWNFDFVNETPLEGDWQWYFTRTEGNSSDQQKCGNARGPRKDESRKKNNIPIS